MDYEAVIGLEVHAQLLTDSKVFCGCSTTFGAPQNTQVCPVCLGLPGVLPVLNRKALELAIKTGLALHCRIAPRSIFARKNYFYPDLPKGYQISQYEMPLCEDGYIEIEVQGQRKRVGIIRIHLEEDAGKSIHAEAFVGEEETLVDINRCGVPLIEIVSKPDLRSPAEAYVYLTRLKQILQYLEVSGCNMEEGSLRCDANVSVRPRGQKEFGVKTEVKNMNSFRAVEKALESEVKRQIEVLQSGGRVDQETLLWDPDRGLCVPMRTKEYAHDYRYFPEPDLVPLEVDTAWIVAIQSSLPEMPQEKADRLISQYGLPKYVAEVLTDQRAVADYFEAVANVARDPKTAGHWVMGEVLRVLNERKIQIGQLPVKPEQLGEMLNLMDEGVISGKMAKTIFDEMVATGKGAGAIVQEKGLIQVTDRGELERAVEEMLRQSQAEVEKYLGGKEQLFGYFVGQVMKATAGKANPKLVNEILRAKLEALRKTKR